MNGSASLGRPSRGKTNGDVRTRTLYDNGSHMTSDLVYPAPPHCSCRLDDYTVGRCEPDPACMEELPAPPALLHGMPEARVHACPRGWRAWLSTFLLVILPMLALLTIAAVWLGKAKKEYNWLEQRNQYVENQLLQIVSLIISLNTERECAALYVASRDEAAEDEALLHLDAAAATTDQHLAALAYAWPGTQHDGYMFKSGPMLQAVLHSHRDSLNVDHEFKREMHFYTNIVHTVCAWFFRDAMVWRESHIWPYLLGYSYLLGSINLLGAEQTMCSVYHSVICFSHTETFLYANYSFSGEAVFKMYRQSYPGVKEDTWESQSHLHVFPNLHECRKELMADVNYPGVSSMCDYSHKNETRFRDLDILLYNENDKLQQHIRTAMAKELHEAYIFLINLLVLSAGILLYFILVHLLRCSCMSFARRRERHKWRAGEYMSEEDKLAHIALNEHPTVIGYDDCHHDLSTTSTAYIKVATV